jgi:hypothetical protein
MRHRCVQNRNRLFAGLLSGLLFAIIAVPLGAQTAPESRAGQGIGSGYGAAHETTLNGTIQEVITQNVAGSPAGMHLLVDGAQGVVDVHVGPFLSSATKEALHVGTPVQIVGAPMLAHGKEYFLARELSVGGRTITIRSKRGFLAHPHGERSLKTTAVAGTEENGGTR